MPFRTYFQVSGERYFSSAKRMLLKHNALSKPIGTHPLTTKPLRSVESRERCHNASPVKVKGQSTRKVRSISDHVRCSQSREHLFSRMSVSIPKSHRNKCILGLYCFEQFGDRGGGTAMVSHF